MPTSRPRVAARRRRVPLALLAGAVGASALTAPAHGVGGGGAAGADPGVGSAPAATLLYFSDAHEIGPVVSDGQDRGGVARLGAAIEAVRSEQPATAVTFGGDLAGGTLFGGLYRGVPMVEALDTIGVDVANFGQHDFDFGVQHARELVAASDFPWISSNLALPTGEPFAEHTWYTQEVGGLTVGYIGITDAMETTSVAGQVVERDHVEAAREAVAVMSAAADPDVVVALTQVGLEDGRALADAVPELDAVLLEETAEYESLVEDHGGTVIASAEGNIGSMIRLDLSVTGEDATVVPSVVEVDHTVTPDPGLRAVEERYRDEMDAQLAEELGAVPTPLLRGEHLQRQGETLIGNALADAFRAHHGADIGWVNGGGVRADVARPVMTLRDAYSVFPFDNKVVGIEVPGSALRPALEAAVSRVESLGGGFPQVSGMAFEFDPTAPVGERIGAIEVGGEPVDDARLYDVALTDYVLGGGDAVTAFAEAIAAGTGRVLVDADGAPSDAEVLAQHVRERGELVSRLAGRIVAPGALTRGPGPERTAADIPVTARIPGPDDTDGPSGRDGALTLSVTDGVLELGRARATALGTALHGTLPAVTVTDSRADGAGWVATGRAGDLRAEAAGLGAEHLGWAPFLAEPPADAARGAVMPGAPVAPRLQGGAGLAHSATLARGDGAPGSAVLGADVTLLAPAGTAPGSYRGAVTVSVFPVD